MVLVQKEERKRIYEYLIKEGVMVVKKVRERLISGCLSAQAPAHQRQKPSRANRC
jgi:hypothetical protein